MAFSRIELVVREGALRVVVAPAQPGVAGQRVEVPPVLLDVLPVIPLRPGQAEHPLLEDGVDAVPEGEGEAQPLVAVADPAHAVLVPAVGAGAGLVVRQVVPGVAVGGVVLADRAPRALREVGSPAMPRPCRIGSDRSSMEARRSPSAVVIGPQYGLAPPRATRTKIRGIPRLSRGGLRARDSSLAPSAGTSTRTGPACSRPACAPTASATTPSGRGTTCTRSSGRRDGPILEGWMTLTAWAQATTERAHRPDGRRQHVPRAGAHREDGHDARPHLERPGHPRHRRGLVRDGARGATASRSATAFPSACAGWPRRCRSCAGCSTATSPAPRGPRYATRAGAERPAADPAPAAAAHRRWRRAGDAQARGPLRRREQRRRRDRERPAQGGDPRPALRDGRA